MIVPIVPTFKEKLDGLKAMLNYDTMWDILAGNLQERISELLQHMLDVNPNLGTLEAIKAVVDKYFNKILTQQDCSNIIAYLGLYPVLTANKDVSIIMTFKAAYQRGILRPYQLEGFRNMAILWNAIAIVEEARERVVTEQMEGESLIDAFKRRIKALMEFGLNEEDANKTQFKGGTSPFIWNKNRYETFYPYTLAGLPELEAWSTTWGGY